jgi:hypothetical protein
VSLQAKQRSARPKNHGPASCSRPRPSAGSAPLSQPLYCLPTRPTSPPCPAPQLISPPHAPPRRRQAHWRVVSNWPSFFSFLFWKGTPDAPLCSFFFLFTTSPRRDKLGGVGPRDALGRHPPADPRRWRPASGPVAGPQIGIIAGNLRGI